jgi:hypothetical protein
MKLKPTTDLIFSTFDTEQNAFSKYVSHQQKVAYRCSVCNILSETEKEFLLIKEQDGLCYLNINSIETCKTCSSITTAKFINQPICLLLETFAMNQESQISLEDIPLSVSIDNKNFNFLFFTVFSSNHYTSIFRLNGGFYLVDDLSKSLKKLNKSKNYEIKTVFYYLF